MAKPVAVDNRLWRQWSQQNKGQMDSTETGLGPDTGLGTRTGHDMSTGVSTIPMEHNLSHMVDASMHSSSSSSSSSSSPLSFVDMVDSDYGNPAAAELALSLAAGNSPYQDTLTIHLISTPDQHTLSIHPPKHPLTLTFTTFLFHLSILSLQCHTY